MWDLAQPFSSLGSPNLHQPLRRYLTHAGLYEDDEVEKLHQEAINLYGDIIDEEKILVVDSLLKLISLDLTSGKTVDQIISESPHKVRLLDSYQGRCVRKNLDLHEEILKGSRFDLMEDAIDHFGSKAPLLQLREVVSFIKNGLQNVCSEYQSRIKRLEKKKKKPQEYESEIASIEERIKKYNHDMNLTVESTRQNFSGTNNKAQEKFNELKNNYSDLLEKSDSEDEIRKCYTDFIDQIDQINEKYVEDITSFLKKKCMEVGADFKADKYLSIPKINVDLLAKNIKSESYDDEDITAVKIKIEKVKNRSWKNLWKFWKKDKKITYTEVIGSKRVFNQAKYLKSLKRNINEEINKLKTDMYGNQGKQEKQLKTLLDKFKTKIKNVVKSLQDTLKDEKRSQQDNKATIEQITVNKKTIESLKEKIRYSNEILENII